MLVLFGQVLKRVYFNQSSTWGQPNWGFNADANIGHGFAIFMAYVGTLRTSCSGAG